MRQCGSTRISQIGVHIVYYNTCALFSSTKSKINDREKFEQVKVVILYKSVMDSNTLLFGTIVPKIGRGKVGQAQVVSTCVQLVAPVVDQ